MKIQDYNIDAMLVHGHKKAKRIGDTGCKVFCYVNRDGNVDITMNYQFEGNISDERLIAHSENILKAVVAKNFLESHRDAIVARQAELVALREARAEARYVEPKVKREKPKFGQERAEKILNKIAGMVECERRSHWKIWHHRWNVGDENLSEVRMRLKKGWGNVTFTRTKGGTLYIKSYQANRNRFSRQGFIDYLAQQDLSNVTFEALKTVCVENLDNPKYDNKGLDRDYYPLTAGDLS